MATQVRTRGLFAKSSSYRQNATPSGITNGTPGGITAAGRGPGRVLVAGDEVYLWLLVLVEMLVLGILRKKFRRYHGG